MMRRNNNTMINKAPTVILLFMLLLELPFSAATKQDASITDVNDGFYEALLQREMKYYDELFKNVGSLKTLSSPLIKESHTLKQRESDKESTLGLSGFNPVESVSSVLDSDLKLKTHSSASLKNPESITTFDESYDYPIDYSLLNWEQDNSKPYASSSLKLPEKATIDYSRYNPITFESNFRSKNQGKTGKTTSDTSHNDKTELSSSHLQKVPKPTAYSFSNSKAPEKVDVNPSYYSSKPEKASFDYSRYNPIAFESDIREKDQGKTGKITSDTSHNDKTELSSSHREKVPKLTAYSLSNSKAPENVYVNPSHYSSIEFSSPDYTDEEKLFSKDAHSTDQHSDTFHLKGIRESSFNTGRLAFHGSQSGQNTFSYDAPTQLTNSQYNNKLKKTEKRNSPTKETILKTPVPAKSVRTSFHTGPGRKEQNVKVDHISPGVHQFWMNSGEMIPYKFKDLFGLMKAGDKHFGGTGRNLALHRGSFDNRKDLNINPQTIRRRNSQVKHKSNPLVDLLGGVDFRYHFPFTSFV